MFNFLMALRIIIIYNAIFNINTAYASNVTVINIGPGTYRLEGSITLSDLKPTVAPPLIGIVMRYMPIDSKYASQYENKAELCSTNRAYAVQDINREIAKAILVNYNDRYLSYRNNTIFFQCSTRYDFTANGWTAMVKTLPAPARCSISAPSEVNFGTVNEGDTKSIQIQAPIRCDKAASVRLTLSANSTAGILTMNGTVIKYGINGTSPSAVIKVSAGITSAASLNFTLSDTGNIAGEKKGYILLVSEVL